MNTKTMRLPVDLIEAAESEAVSQHRSASKQLEHWARFGMLFDHQSTDSLRRIHRVVAGEALFTGLSDDERLVAHATIDANISASANSISFADRLAARGVTTVSMNADGQMVRRQPDGTISVL
jgi:ParD-like antitoxin of type II bacterial toxin-antitoxin system